jgi:2-keto-4-pentenoate hydratase
MMRAMTEVETRVVAALNEQLESWRADLADGASRAGWKVGLNVPEVMERLGLTEPVIGYLTSQGQVEDGGTYDARRALALRVEAEVAVRLGAGGSIESVAPSIEVVDVVRPAGGGVEPIIVMNVFHKAFVLGPMRPDMPEGLEARLVIGGEERGRARIDTDLAGTVDLVARRLASVGEQLEAGDVIITGAILIEPVQPGDDVLVEMGELGSVRLTITE